MIYFSSQDKCLDGVQFENNSNLIAKKSIIHV